MGEQQCRIDELRTLFLFEQLSDTQLAILCAQGRIETFPEGPLIREGEPATCFYVMVDGELVMSSRMGGIDVQTHRTSQRGVYCGAWLAYIPSASHIHEVTIHLTRPSRFFVLDAPQFADFMHSQFPMAVHLLAGHTLGTLRQQQILGQRARLLALGTITAGLTHHLNNPAAAIARAAADLRRVFNRLGRRLALVAEGPLSANSVHALAHLQSEVSIHLRTRVAPTGGALAAADLEERVGDWLAERGVTDAWDHASTFAEAGLDITWLERVSCTMAGADARSGWSGLQVAVEWLKDFIDGDLRIGEVTDASRRMSTLLAGAKQYSQMDRGTYQRVDVHDLLRSTLLMFDGRIGAGTGIELVTEWDESLSEISCYAGDLNQVWTNIIDNALEAMDGGGTLTVRTMTEGDAMLCVEIGDDGPGIPNDVVDRIFTAFFTTKPAGEGSGLGLDLAWRIVEKHGGNLAVESAPGDTRFSVRLPLRPLPQSTAMSSS